MSDLVRNQNIGFLMTQLMYSYPMILLIHSSRKTKVRPGEVLMVKEEKALVKIAAEAPEQFDNWETVATEAQRVADWIKQAKHCVAFTGKVFWSIE